MNYKRKNEQLRNRNKNVAFDAAFNDIKAAPRVGLSKPDAVRKVTWRLLFFIRE